MIADLGIYGASFQQAEGGDTTKSPILTGRVTDIILDSSHPLWEAKGGWDALGMIFFTPVYGEIISNNFAKPMFANMKNYPLKEELVLLTQLPDPSVSSSPNKSSWYYMNSINIWNHPHHNALPNLNQKQNTPQQLQLNYKETEAGVVKKQVDSNFEIKLGNTFIENAKVKPLLPFEGDIIWEGRFGQSFRFGSTVKDKNPWSQNDQNEGNPITIIKNGQTLNTKDPNKGWIPVLEDINNDGSSVYMTQGQAIPIIVASKNQKSFTQTLQEVIQPVIIISDNPNLVTASIAQKQEVTENKTFKEEDLTFHFPGEETPVILFDNDEEPISRALDPIIYDSNILQNESFKTKENEEYLLHAEGKVVDKSSISWILGYNNRSIRVSNAYKSYVELILKAANSEGINLQLTSGFRTYDEQLNYRKKNLIDKTKINDMDFLLNASSDNFKPETARPGHSSHEIGRAFDFNTGVTGVNNWLIKNAYTYKFVRTVISEEWHYEYLPGVAKDEFVK